MNRGDYVENYKVGDIVKGCVTGIEKYGIFVNLDNYYTGLIHISEISEKFVSNINDYVTIGETISVKIIDKNDDDYHLKLSIKNLDYRINKKIRTKIKETPKGFNTLKEYLPVWIEEKLHKIDNN